MALPFTLIKSTEQVTSAWPGGTTTELAIFPPGANYAARSFHWRLSTAAVAAPESTFTRLPGWRRLLMVLAGEMTLAHTEHHRVRLLPFQQDHFDGGWLTHCAGTGRDFNLMLAQGWQGRLQAIRLAGEGVIGLPATAPEATEVFYCFSGRAQARLPAAELLLATGDCLLLPPGSSGGRLIEMSPDTPTLELIRASIWPE